MKKIKIILSFISLFLCSLCFLNNVLAVDKGTEDNLWNEFVEKYTNSETLKLYEEMGCIFEIDSTDNSLNVVGTWDDYSYEVVFNYSNGIVTYVLEEELKDVNNLYEIFIKTIFPVNSIYALADMKQYNTEKVGIWLNLDENNSFTLEKDGIEYTIKEYTSEQEDEFGHSSVSSEIITALKLDIVNGFKTYDESKIKLYKIVKGENQEYEIGKTESLSIQVDTNLENIDKVYVDDNLVEENNYDIVEDDEIVETAITLKKEYLDKLITGEHSIKIVFSDNEFVETKFNVIAKKHEILEGENQKYEIGKSEFLTVRVDAEFDLFDNVYVDGNLVEKTNYDAKSGSTIVTLKKEYLDKLNNGEHTLIITFKDGNLVETKFDVEVNSVDTGVNFAYGILTLVVLSILAVYVLIRKQSKFPKHN